MKKSERWPESEIEPGDVVYEVGAYEGAWVYDIKSSGAIIRAFEPSPDTFKRLEKNVGNLPQIHLYNFGLGGRNITIPLGSNNTDGASFVKDDEFTVPAKMVDIADFIGRVFWPGIKIMHINIEGGEYELIARLIDTGYIDSVEYIMIHWHDVPPGAMIMRLDIERDLWKTHRPHLHPSNPTWDIWERTRNGLLPQRPD